MDTIQLVEIFYSTVEKSKPVPVLPSRAHALKIRELDFNEVGYAVLDFVTVSSEKTHLINFDVACRRRPANKEAKEEQFQLIEGIGRFFDEIFIVITSSANLVVLLNHITSHCTKAHSLYISSSETPSSEDSPAFKKECKKSSSIKKLVFSRHMPKPNQLLYTLSQLPCLETLSLRNLFIKEDSSWNHHFSTYLPHVSLQCLEIEMDIDFKGLVKEKGIYYIKLVTDTESKPRYCFFIAVYTAAQKTFLGYNIIENPTESVYQASILDPRYSTHLIYCKFVEKFTLSYISVENGHFRTLNL